MSVGPRRSSWSIHEDGGAVGGCRRLCAEKYQERRDRPGREGCCQCVPRAQSYRLARRRQLAGLIQRGAGLDNSEYLVRSLGDRRARAEHALHTQLLQIAVILLGDYAADNHRYIAGARFL